jgi:hypothetical protein
MTKVFIAQHPLEAHFVKGMLESNGIPSEIRGEALFGVRGELPIMETSPEVWILNDDQVNEALAVLRYPSTEPNEAGKHQAWRCARCGETIEPQFTACWQCNADK